MSKKSRASRDDGVAVERYEFVLATAQPDQLYRVHAEAFAALTDEQRGELRTRLGAGSAVEADRPIDDRPESLARVATDVETQRQGSLAGLLGPLLAAVARQVVASPVAIALFPYDYAAGTGLWAEDADDDSSFF